MSGDDVASTQLAKAREHNKFFTRFGLTFGYRWSWLVSQLLIEPVLLGLWTYWCSKRADRAPPRFDDIDLSALGDIADHVLIVKKESNGRFRYATVGSSIQTIFGYPMEGLYLDVALPPGRRKQAIQRYAVACNEARPILTRTSYQVSKTVEFFVDRLILPLAHPDGLTGGVINAQVMRSAKRSESLDRDITTALNYDELIYLDERR